MCFLQNLKIIIFIFFPFFFFHFFFTFLTVLTDDFHASILWKCIWSRNLLSATFPIVLSQSFWNFTGVLLVVWGYACALGVLKLCLEVSLPVQLIKTLHVSATVFTCFYGLQAWSIQTWPLWWSIQRSLQRSLQGPILSPTTTTTAKESCTSRCSHCLYECTIKVGNQSVSVCSHCFNTKWR